jgi:hypothetical protein
MPDKRRVRVNNNTPVLRTGFQIPGCSLSVIEPPGKGPQGARDAVNGANARNKKMGYSEEFTLGDLNFLWKKCHGKCAVSGLEFSFVRIGNGKAQRLFAPSLDRIDPAKPYTRKNVRIVVQVANFAMNAWGFSPVHRLAEGILCLNGRNAELRPSLSGSQLPRAASSLSARR